MDTQNQNTSSKEQSQPVRNNLQDNQPETRERLWKAESEIPYRSSKNKVNNSETFDFQPAGKDEQQLKDEKLWRQDAPDIPEEADLTDKVRNDQQQYQNYLTKEDLPDATNESKGKMGSGQRQDSN